MFNIINLNIDVTLGRRLRKLYVTVRSIYSFIILDDVALASFVSYAQDAQNYNIIGL